MFSKTCYIRFDLYLCLLLLLMVLIVCHFIPPCDVSEGIVWGLKKIELKGHLNLWGDLKMFFLEGPEFREDGL